MATEKTDRPTYAVDYIKGDWDKAVYLDNPHTDNLMTAFLNLGAEHWAMRRRMMVLEHLLSQTKTVDQAQIEAFEPSPEQKIAWEAERDDFIKRTFSVLTRETAMSGNAATAAKAPK